MGDDKLYLQKMRLKDFRAYKNPIDVTFPDGPGLTVIVGPNGLGKSTLFDGIEWGLTGQLKRIESITAKEKEKKLSIGDQPEVDLWFNDDTHIHRTRPIASASTTSVAITGPAMVEKFGIDASGVDESDIVRWLAKSSWHSMDNIADCLHFTHFLGQSTRQLFVHQDGKERWNRLQGPIGIRTLWNIEQALGRPQTTNAFNKVEDTLEKQLRHAHEEKQRVEKLLKSIEQQRMIARANSAIPPEEIRSRLEALQDALGDTFGYAKPEKTEDIDDCLKSQINALEQAEKDVSEKQAQLQEWQNLSREYIKQGRHLTALDNSVMENRQSKVKIDTELQQALTEASRSRESHQAAEDELKQHHLRFQQLTIAIEQQEKLVRTRETVETLTAAIETCKERIKQLDVSIKTQNEALRAAKDRRKYYEKLNNRQRKYESLEALCLKYRQADTYLEQTKKVAEEVIAGKSTLLEKLTDAEEGLRQAEATVTALDYQRQDVTAKASAMVKLVSQIANTLSDEDCECPVCKTTFYKHGELKTLAQESVSSTDEFLAEINKALEASVYARKDARALVTSINQQIADIDEKQALQHSAMAQVQQLEQQLRLEPLLATSPVEDFLPLVTQARIDEIAKIDKVVVEIRDSVSVSDIEAELARLRAELQQVKQNLQRTTGNLGNTRFTLKTVEAEVMALTLSPQTETDESVQQSLEAFQAAKSQTELAVERVQAVFDKSKGDLKESEALLRQKQHTLAIVTQTIQLEEKELANIHMSRQALVDRWCFQAYEGEPTLEVVTTELSKIPSLLGQLQRLQVDHKQLVDGRQHYADLTHLQRMEAELSDLQKQHDVSNENELQDKLTTAENDISKELDKLRVIRDKRNSLQNRLKERNTDIRNNINKPLNASVAKFCSALMSDRNFNVSVDNIASAASAQSLLSFQLNEVNTDPRKNPLLYLSEGQLAAIGLCLQFGASVTYPWSHWKALLLDDPLHHNDTVHAAAFIDVVRNLINEQDYQVIVSTHDMELAGYFLRKCENAGIPSRYWHLYGRNEQGVMMQRGRS